MFIKNTERARKVMELASEQARQFNHEYIGTEHVLLGLLGEGTGAAAGVLKNLGVDLPKVRLEFEKLVKRGPAPVAKGRLPLTPRLKEAVKHAMEEVKGLAHKYIGTEHLLLGLLHERAGVAAQILMTLGLDLEKVRQELLGVLGVAPPVGDADDDGLPEELVVPAAAVEYVNQLLIDAVKAHASDIHFDQSESGPGHVRMRIDGVLREVDPPAEGMLPKVISRVKVMAAMSTSDRHEPQDGSIMVELDRRHLDLRVSVVPAYYGERLVIRVLDREQVTLKLSDLGLLEQDLAKTRQLCRLPQGIVIVNGPAGSGKTTTLYCMLNEINRPDVSILTVEDPVEFTFEGIGQIQVSPQTGLTFSRAIRHVLRQDPDVILVGEIRDLETMECCIQCAMTGHLVMTTLHANTSIGAIRRMLDIGIAPFMINSALASVISQQLVRILCSKCKQPTQPEKHLMPPGASEFISALNDVAFYGPKGCRECAGSGYRGRTGVNEILTMDDRLRQLLTSSPDLAALSDAAREGGMKTMLQNGLEKAAHGITSIEEVLRVVPVGACAYT